MPNKSNPQGRQQNNALSARREKNICILCCNSGSRPCELGAKQTIFQDEPGGRLQSRLRGSLEAVEIAIKQKRKDEREFLRQASTAEIGANAHEYLFFNRFTFIERAVATLLFTWANVLFC